MTIVRLWARNRFVRAAFTLALAVFVVYKADPARVLRAAGTADLEYLIVALTLTLPFLAFKTLRWYLMLREAGISATAREATTSLIGGMGLALVTPARVGEVVRGAYIRDPQKLKIAGLVLLDKGFDVLVLCALSLAGAWRLIGPGAAGALAAAAIVGLAVVYLPRRVHSLLERLTVHLPGRLTLNRLWGSLESLSAPATTTFLALTALSFAVVLVQFALILLSWRAWSFDIVLLTFPLVILTNVLPITVGGLGVREGTAALLLSHYGVSAAHAEVAAFLMFAMNTALPGLLGAVALPLLGARKASEARRPAGP